MQDAQVSSKIILHTRYRYHDGYCLILHLAFCILKAFCILNYEERLTGVEPASSAWEADALPLCYNRITESRCKSTLFFRYEQIYFTFLRQNALFCAFYSSCSLKTSLSFNTSGFFCSMSLSFSSAV